MIKLPVIKKMTKTNNFLVERVLPEGGELSVKKGDVVEPFVKIGSAEVSNFSQKVDPTYTLVRDLNTYIEKGVQIAEKKVGSLKVSNLYAPYSGFLRQSGASVVFEQDKELITLLSGTWGTVKDVIEKKAVLISSSATTLYCAVSTPFEAEGELVVLPNPTELIEDPYFNNFTKDIAGKIIYSGHNIKLENLKKAKNLGVRGIFAGSFDKAAYEYSLENNFFLGSLSGYGRIPTPDPIFMFLNSVSSRYIFARGKKGEIYIPSAEKFNEEDTKPPKDFFVEIKNGMMVQVLERPYFGWLGTVDTFFDDKVSVKLSNSIEVVSVKATNLLLPAF